MAWEFYYHPDGDKPDASYRICTECRYFKGYVTLWCTNDKAMEYRGTNMGCVYHCHFWKPMKAASWVKRIWPFKPRLEPSGVRTIITKLKLGRWKNENHKI